MTRADVGGARTVWYDVLEVYFSTIPYSSQYVLAAVVVSQPWAELCCRSMTPCSTHRHSADLYGLLWQSLLLTIQLAMSHLASMAVKSHIPPLHEGRK